MPARTGQEYLRGLRERRREVMPHISPTTGKRVFLPELERYLATDTASARERAKLFPLAWDVACSAFGGRQVLYERFFGGDPVRNAMILYNFYGCKPLMDRVPDFLQRDD
jgi:aromatic ring hydroxylase